MYIYSTLYIQSKLFGGYRPRESTRQRVAVPIFELSELCKTLIVTYSFSLPEKSNTTEHLYFSHCL